MDYLFHLLLVVSRDPQEAAGEREGRQVSPRSQGLSSR